MSDVARNMPWQCCFCGKSGDLRAPYTVEIIIEGDSDDGVQNMFAHPKCLIERLDPIVPTMIDLDEERDDEAS